MVYRIHTHSLLLCLLFIIPSSEASYNLAQELLKLAQKCQKENQNEKAIEYYKQIVRIQPNNFQVALLTAGLLYNSEKFEDALDYYHKALSIDDSRAEAYYNCGLTLFQLGRKDAACEAFSEAISKDPHHIKSYIKRGIIYSDRKDHNRAYTVYKEGLKHNPEDFLLNHRMGQAARALEKYEESIAYFKKAISLNPNSILAIHELANTFHMIDEYDQAIDLYEKALTMKPDYVAAWYNLGLVIKKHGSIHTMAERIRKSIEVHAKTLEMRPDYPAAHFSQALSYLTLGDFEHGWPEYEYRWGAYNEKPKQFSQPVWEGQDLNGKRIFIYAEQGYGDTFQFIRYAQLLKDRGAYVIVQPQRHLKDIISQCPYIDRVVVGNEIMPEFDYHIALMSIPMVVKTTVESVPHNIPYLHAKQELITEWKEKLSADKNFKIGICWQGNNQYRTIFLKKEVASKAMQLKAFEPLTSVHGISLYSLQKINGTDQLNEVKDTMIVHELGPDFDDSHGRFMDTAAVIKNLDLIITIDTSIGHLAAGLGAPVWVLLPYPADWRWMLDTNSTPWYQNMRLFRQQTQGDWKSVIEEVVTVLQEKVHGHKQIQPSVQKEKNIQKNHEYTPKKAFVHKEQVQPQSQEAIKKSVPNAISNVVDEMTQRSIAMQHSNSPAHIRSLIADHKVLQETYHPYMVASQEIKALTEQLVVLNKQLWDLEKKLPEDRPTLFDSQFMNLIEEIYAIHSVKKIVMQKISDLAKKCDA